MELTKCQENAFKTFLGFLCTPAKDMVISGPPGVGKTYMTRHLIDELPKAGRIQAIMGKEPINQVALTATTNKAAEVLQQRFPGYTVSTIHSYLGIGVKDNYKTGKTELVKTPNFKVAENTLIFIDEASMEDTPLLNMIDEGTKNCKLIHIGDHCQLAPVSELNSPVFNSGFLTTQLNTQVRTKNSPELSALNDQLRTTVETGIFKPMLPVDGVIEYLSDAQLQNELKLHFIQQETPGHKILAFTNNTVQLYNQYIREQKGLPNTFVVGDVVTSNNSIETSKEGNRTVVEKSYVVQHVGPISQFEGISYYTVNIGAGGDVLQPLNYQEVSNLLRRLAAKQDWFNYFNVKNMFADLRLSYAQTAHKSQGSTYHTVYVDLGDIGTCRDANTIARLIYVACSRATTRVCFYGSLPVMR